MGETSFSKAISKEELELRLRNELNDLLTQPVTIEKIAELLGAEKYLTITPATHRSNRVVRFNVDGFLQEVRSADTQIKLPSSITNAQEVFVPPAGGEIQAGSGVGIEEKKVIPRTRLLIELLSSHGIEYEVIQGAAPTQSLRSLPYNIFILPGFDRLILVNNEEGNATFVVWGNRLKIDEIKNLTKDDLEAREDVERIVFTNGAEWQSKIEDSITRPNPIPLSDKIVKEEYDYPPEGWKMAVDIMRDLNRGRTWINKRIKNEAGKKFISPHKRVVIYYPPELVASLKEESQKHEEAPEGWMTLPQIQEAVKRTRAWVEPRLKGKTSKEFNVEELGKTLTYYPPEVVAELLEEAKKFEPAPEGWLTLSQLEKATKRQASWITSRLKNYPPGREFSHPNMSRLTLYYPPEVAAEIVKEAEKVEPAPEGWLTIDEISKLVPFSRGWIRKKLEGLEDKSKIYLTQRHHPATHYPPEVVAELLEEAKKFEPAPEGWLTIDEIANILKRDNTTIEKKVHGDSGKIFLNKVRRAHIHYPPEEIERLKSEIDQFEPAPEGWLTIRGLSDTLGKDWGWVERRIRGEGKKYWSPLNRLDIFYPPEEVARLKNLSQDSTKDSK